MNWILKRSFIFYLFFNFEISFAMASTKHFIDLPAGCSKVNVHPCDISSGENSYGFESSAGTWEMASGTVLRRYQEDLWKMASGRFVVSSVKPQWVETPFGKIHIRNSKVFINLSATKVEMSTISGDPIRFVSRIPGNQYWVHPGMKKWVSGIGSQGIEAGETEVIDLKEYALARARFFSDYKRDLRPNCLISVLKSKKPLKS